MREIYSGYRGKKYCETRHRWEPWYSQNANGANSITIDHIRDRRTFMASVIEKVGPPLSLECAVDFGGDEGQFFPDIITKRRVVIDVSDRTLPPGIERIASLEELGNAKADFVIVAHVLEHLSDPLQSLIDLRKVTTKDCIVYVEVPLDGFKVGGRQDGERYKDYLQKIMRHRSIFVSVDFLTGVTRQFRAEIPIWGVIKQSEHINYFSESSLSTLLEMAGFCVMSGRADPRAKVGGMRIGRYGLVAKPRES